MRAAISDFDVTFPRASVASWEWSDLALWAPERARDPLAAGFLSRTTLLLKVCRLRRRRVSRVVPCIHGSQCRPCSATCATPFDAPRRTKRVAAKLPGIRYLRSLLEP